MLILKHFFLNNGVDSSFDMKLSPLDALMAGALSNWGRTSVGS